MTLSLRLSCLALLALAAPAVAHAQSSELEPSYVATMGSIRDELHAAEGLYVLSALLEGGGGSTMLWGVITTTSCASLSGCPEGKTLFYVGLALLPIGVVALAIAIALDVDALSRRGALRAGRVWIGPGPGELGLALGFDWDS